MITVPADELREGDILLASAGENVWTPWPTWSSGQPKKITKVELIARVTFDDYGQAEWPAEHQLDVDRKEDDV